MIGKRRQHLIDYLKEIIYKIKLPNFSFIILDFIYIKNPQSNLGLTFSQQNR